MNLSYGFFISQCHKEVILLIRNPQYIIYSGLFFLLTVAFFPLTVTPSFDNLRWMVSGIIWVAMLLSMLYSVSRVFTEDLEQGLLEQHYIANNPLLAIVYAKLLVQWLAVLIPMILCIPLLAILFQLTTMELLVLLMSIIVGSPTLLLLVSLASVFTLANRQALVIMALIVFPLAVPTMIFGSASLILTMQHASARANLALLAACSLLAGLSVPYAIAKMLEISLND